MTASLPCAIELNSSGVQHTHSAPATERHGAIQHNSLTPFLRFQRRMQCQQSSWLGRRWQAHGHCRRRSQNAKRRRCHDTAIRRHGHRFLEYRRGLECRRQRLCHAGLRFHFRQRTLQRSQIHSQSRSGRRYRHRQCQSRGLRCRRGHHHRSSRRCRCPGHAPWHLHFPSFWSRRRRPDNHRRHL
jgi:hypothetical protein